MARMEHDPAPSRSILQGCEGEDLEEDVGRLQDCTGAAVADELAIFRRRLKICRDGAELVNGEFEDLHPGRYTVFGWQLPADGHDPVSVSVLDSPPDHDPRTPFAAILVPRGRELDWIFCTENGQWDLLFSASVSRLVVLKRLFQATSKSTEKEGLQHTEISSSTRGTDDGLQTDPGVSVVDADNSIEEAASRNAENKGLQHTETSSSRRGTGGDLSVSAVDADNSIEDEDEVFKKEVDLLLISLFPWLCFPNRFPIEPFVSYEDGVAIRLIVEKAYSPLSGSILVEDVELLGNRNDEEQNSTGSHKIELRRRMRFQRTPNSIQTEIPITVCKNGQPVLLGLEAIRDGEDLEVRPDHNELVHTYLPPIVAGLVLASSRLEACEVARNKVRVLSIGIGGGALPIFLHRKLGFHVLAIDLDEVVLRLARCHFGLEEDEHLHIQVNDGVDAVVSIAKEVVRSNLVAVELLKEWQQLSQDVQGHWCRSSSLSEQPEGVDVRMDVIIVDVNAGDPRLGLTSPPPVFLQKMFLLAARIALQDGGILVMNIIPWGPKHYKLAVEALRQVFAGLYQIQVEDNHVVFALPSKIHDINLNCTFALHLMQAIDKDWIYQIVEVI